MCVLLRAVKWMLPTASLSCCFPPPRSRRRLLRRLLFVVLLPRECPDALRVHQRSPFRTSSLSVFRTFHFAHPLPAPAMPPKKAKKEEKKKDDKGDKDKKKSDANAVSDAIRFFPEQKRLERLEEENVRILLSFKGLHEQLRAQVLDQEDILQHFEREMGAKDAQILALNSEIQTQQSHASSALERSQKEISLAKLECERQLAEQEAKVRELEESLESTQSLRERFSALEQQLKECQEVLAEERLFCRNEVLRIASDHEAKLLAVRRIHLSSHFSAFCTKTFSAGAPELSGQGWRHGCSTGVACAGARAIDHR
jgi:hypothetical protein